MKKKIILAFVLILVIVLISVAILIIKNNEDSDYSENGKKNSSKTDLKIEEIFFNVLKDNELFENITNIKVQVADLNNDKIPELVIYGSKSGTEHIAEVFSIIKSNKKEKLKEINISNEFELSYMYNLKEEKYDWYVVPDESSVVYILDFDDESLYLNETEQISNFIEVETPNMAVEFNNLLTEDEIKEFLDEVMENYISNEEIVTEKVEQKIEAQKAIAGLKKINNDKSIVFSADKYIYENKQYDGKIETNYYQYPYINIDNKDIKQINSEIAQKYGFSSDTRDGELLYSEIEVENYFAYINGNILSVIPFSGGNDSTWTEAYNIDLTTISKLDNNTLILDTINLDEIKDKFKEYAKNLTQEKIDEMNQVSAQDWYVQIANEEMKKFEDSLEKDFDDVYLNADGDVIIRTKLWVLGGQQTCQKILEINATKNGEVTEFDYSDYVGKDLDPVTNYDINKENTIKLNENSIDLSEYIGMDIKEASEKLNFEKGKYTSGIGPDFYHRKDNTTIQIEAGENDSKIIRASIGSNTKDYNICGIVNGMTYSEVKTILEKIGVESVNSSLHAYTFYLNNGTNVVINLRGDYYNIVDGFTINKTTSTSNY